MFGRLASRTWRAAIAEELLAGPRALRNTAPWLWRARRGQISTVLDVAIRNASEAPHDLAFEMDDERLTWSDLDATTSRIAHVLSNAGVKKGDVVALIAENSPFYVAAVLGITRVGAIGALINTNLKGRPLAHAVDVANARVALVSHGLADGLSEVREGLSTLESVITLSDDPYAGVLGEAPSTSFEPAEVSMEDDFVYIYTSGTTGLPKPCRMSHERVILAAAGFGPLMFGYQPGDKLYCVLTLYHSSGLLLGTMTSILSRVPTAIRRSFSASAFWDDVHRYQATAFLYIGELCRYLVNSPPHPKESDNPLRVAAGNGLRPDVWPEFRNRFHIDRIREFYGATEAPGFIANLSGREGSVGRVPMGGLGGMYRLVKYDIDTDAHVRDAKGFCIPSEIGEPGELLIRIADLSGGLDFRGYTDKAATSKKVLESVFKKGDRYYRSGDLLRRDAEGFYFFVDRIGDTFRWKGENVSTAEVADVIGQSDSIQEATVTGIQVPNMEGQAGLAAIVPTNGFDPAAFDRIVAELPAYAQPRFVRVMGDLAKTGTFKIQKTALRSDGVDPSEVKDQLYVRTQAGYEALTPERWDDVKQGRLKL
ncbi:MAG: AMP-binding protein [Myxococcota bacterium]